MCREVRVEWSILRSAVWERNKRWGSGDEQFGQSKKRSK